MRRLARARWTFVLWIVVAPASAAAQAPMALPSPLSLGDVVQLAGERRDEIQAARARIRAGEARPDIVSALADPMLSPSISHLPFMGGGADVNITVEQQTTLSPFRWQPEPCTPGACC